jgi:hypothetical protein
VARAALFAALLAAGGASGAFPPEARAQEGTGGAPPADSTATDSVAVDPAAPDPAAPEPPAPEPTAPEPAAPLDADDAAAVAAAMAASDSARAVALRGRAVTDPDRLELGVALPEDYFDWLATFGYRRRVRTDLRFQHWLQADLSYGKKEYLSEGAVSVAWMIRPKALWRPEWRVRPVIEFGASGNVVVQFADIVGFDDWSSHARAFAKSHLVAGLETSLGDRLGLALRGRFTIPAHRPLDYAQLLLFFR